MTRDEAIKRFATAVNRPMDEYYSETVHRITPMIDGFVALGMLKLDEPKGGPKQRAVEAMFKHSYENQTNGMITPRHAIEAIERAGLQITEKENG